MASAIEKYWYAVGFWHAKTEKNIPPSQIEIEYHKEMHNLDILKEYQKGHKAGS